MNREKKLLFQQSGVIPYRIHQGSLEILLITSRKSKRWVIPKGLIELHMNAAESAMNEAWEEAGIRGQVSETAIGTYEYKKWGGTCHVEVFGLHVETLLQDWPEDSIRQRQWFSVTKAAERVREADLKQMILALPTALDRL